MSAQSVQSLTEEVKKHFTWSIFMGLLSAALGVFLIIYPLATTIMTTVLLGWALIFVGLTQLIFALHSQTVGNYYLKVLLSVLYGICGIWLAFFPVASMPALTGILGTLLLIQAAIQTATALQLRPVDGWGWFQADAVTSLLLSILILARWPFNSIGGITSLFGIAVLVGGISRIMIALKIRSGIINVDHVVQRAA
jgi:uncharacterized membrane protein HdeD (DUF308 family)